MAATWHLLHHLCRQQSASSVRQMPRAVAEADEEDVARDAPAAR